MNSCYVIILEIFPFISRHFVLFFFYQVLYVVISIVGTLFRFVNREFTIVKIYIKFYNMFV